jgi:hypothetical protein
METSAAGRRRRTVHSAVMLWTKLQAVTIVAFVAAGIAGAGGGNKSSWTDEHSRPQPAGA